MKKLVLKLLILALFVCGSLTVLDYLSMVPKTKALVAGLTNSEDFLTQGSGTEDIIPIIGSVKENDSSHVLIIGDSIARQMFSTLCGDDPNVRVACANAAINITGQYMLAMEFLDSHPEATDVWLFAHPLTFTRTYDLELGYGYAVMPFAMEGSLKYLEDETLDQMASVYGSFALDGRFAGAVDASPLNRKIFLSYIRMYNSEYEQSGAYEISSLYILKLKAECEKRGVSFHFYSSPSTEYFRGMIEESRPDFMNSELGAVYPEFLDDVFFFSTEWSDDYTHFGAEYANAETYLGVIEEAYGDDYLNNMMKGIYNG